MTRQSTAVGWFRCRVSFLFEYLGVVLFVAIVCAVQLIPSKRRRKRRPRPKAFAQGGGRRPKSLPRAKSPDGPTSKPFRDRLRPRIVAPPLESERCPILYGTRLTGRAHVIDGDTIIVAGHRIRLAGIDAPELDQPYGQASKWEMVRICKGQDITVVLNGFRSYERVVGFCYLADGTDIGAELIRRGLALDWPLFSNGHYREQEPDGARARLLGARRRHLAAAERTDRPAA